MLPEGEKNWQLNKMLRTKKKGSSKKMVRIYKIMDLKKGISIGYINHEKRDKQFPFFKNEFNKKENK